MLRIKLGPDRSIVHGLEQVVGSLSLYEGFFENQSDEGKICLVSECMKPSEVEF